MQWFGKEIIYDALDQPVAPSALFRVISVARTNPEEVVLLGFTAIGAPRVSRRDSWFVFSTQDQRDAALINNFCQDNEFLFFANIISKPFVASQFASLRLFDFHKLKHGFVMNLDDGRWVEIGQYNTSRMIDENGQPVDIATGATYARIVLSNNQLPYIRLDSKHHGARGKGQAADLLEGNFNQTFDVHVADGSQTDARYVLTPDVMNVLLDQYADFDIELCDGCLFLLMPAANYWETNTMMNLMQSVEHIYDLFERRLQHYQNESTTHDSIEPNSYIKMFEQRSA